MDEILDFADAAVQADIDAIILQDMGLFSIMQRSHFVAACEYSDECAFAGGYFAGGKAGI